LFVFSLRSAAHQFFSERLSCTPGTSTASVNNPQKWSQSEVEATASNGITIVADSLSNDV
jgi:hypothetical protein